MCAKTRSSHEAGSVGNETKRLDFRERNETRGLTTTLANNQQRGQSDGELRGRADAGDGRGVRPQRGAQERGQAGGEVAGKEFQAGEERGCCGRWWRTKLRREGGEKRKASSLLVACMCTYKMR